MIDRILAFSIQNRWLVIIAAIAVGALGAWNFTRLPIDAVPDITNVQVQVNTVAPGYSPLEVEQRITFPLETAMGGLPKLDHTRSLSRYGLSQITVVFKDGTDIYFARQLVNERIQQAKDKLPPGIETSMGPVSTGLGEIYMYSVEAKTRRDEARRRALLGHRPADDPGLDHQAAAAHGAGDRRGQHDRRLRAAIPRPARAREADGLPAHLPRRDGGAGHTQCQCRRGLHRAQRRAVSRAHARPGRRHESHPRHRRGLAWRRADPHPGHCRGGGRGPSCAPAPRRSTARKP